LAPVKGLLVVPATYELKQVLATVRSVLNHPTPVSGAVLIERLTEAFFVTPPTSSVVAEALLAANVVRAAAATAARPSMFRYFMSSPRSAPDARSNSHGEQA
jgi:hypothetical protein